MWTTWPVAMADDEITCELPVLQSTFDQGYGNLKGIQSLDAHDLYSNHPPCHFDSLSLFIKAVKLFTEAQRFLRFYQRRPHTVERYINEPNLRLLLSQVNLFRLSIPAHLRRPTRDLAAGGQLDRDLLTAIMLAHATSIALGEPLVTRDTWQHDLATMGLGSIRAILSLVYDSEYASTWRNQACRLTQCSHCHHIRPHVFTGIYFVYLLAHIEEPDAIC